MVPVEEEDEEGGGGRRKSFHCPLHAKACDMRSEENYFFRLSRYEGEGRELLAKGGRAGAESSSSSSSPGFLRLLLLLLHPPSADLVSFVSPRARRNEIATWTAGGLRDFSISRAAVCWGIPLPRDPAQTVYVWFDALLGYASALLTEEEARGSSGSGSRTQRRTKAPLSPPTPRSPCWQAKGWPPSLHLVGKDILRFHAAYWPGMCLSAGLPLPGAVFAHGFLTKDGRKMGKSLGNVLDPNELVARFGADAVRFFLCAGVAFGGDGDFAAARFADTVNAALANTLGNLVNRSASLLHKFFEGGVLPCSADEAVAVVDAYFSSSSSGAASGRRLQERRAGRGRGLQACVRRRGAARGRRGCRGRRGSGQRAARRDGAVGSAEEGRGRPRRGRGGGRRRRRGRRAGRAARRRARRWCSRSRPRG